VVPAGTGGTGIVGSHKLAFRDIQFRGILCRMTTHDRNNLGKILKQRRAMIPAALSQLARAAGVSLSHLSRIERGERFPSAHFLRKIAKPLGFSEGELVTLVNYLSHRPSINAERPRGFWRKTCAVCQKPTARIAKERYCTKTLCPECYAEGWRLEDVGVDRRYIVAVKMHQG